MIHQHLVKAIGISVSILIRSVTIGLAQDFQYQNFNELNGLPSSEVYEVFQDSRGFVWMATDNGVVQYDGRTFNQYNTENGLTDNTVFGFYEDAQSQIWFRTFSRGLCYYRNDSIFPYKFNHVLLNEIGSSLISKFFVDENETLHFSTSMQGMAGAIDSTGNLRMFEAKGYHPYLFIRREANEILYGLSGTARTIVQAKIDDQRYGLVVDDPQEQGSPVMNTFTVGPDIYFTFTKNLWRFRQGKVEKVVKFQRPVISAYKDSREGIWIGFFNGGLSRISAQNFEEQFTIPMLSEYSVSCCMVDREGGLWISTLDHGVFYFPDISIENRLTPNQDKITTVTRFGNLILAGDYAGDVHLLSELGDKKIAQLVPPIQNLFVDRSNRIWVSDAASTHIMDETGAFVVKNQQHFAFKRIVNSESGYLGFNTMGIFHFNEQGTMIDHDTIRQRVNSLETTEGVTLIGSPYGLMLYDETQKSDSASIVLDARISTLRKMSDSIVLVGTFGRGLHCFNTRTGNTRQVEIGRARNVYSIEMGRGSLWLGTESGIVMMDARNIDLPLRHISKSSGLVSDKVNALLVVRDKLWAFTDIGISKIPLRLFTQERETPAPFLKEFLVNSRSFTGDLQHLRPDENNIILSLGVVSFKESFSLFRYRLSPNDRWTTLSGNEIAFSDLSPGPYQVDIEVSTNGVVWVNPLRVHFAINRPWWNTLGFRLFLLILVGLAGYAVYRVRVNSVKRRHNYLELLNSHQQRLIDSEIQTQERERKRIAKDLHDGIGTSLSSIKLMVTDMVEGTADSKKSRVRDINDNLSEVIAEIKRIVYDLHPPALERYGLQVGLKNLVENMNRSQDVHIHLDYYGQREVSSTVSITIYRIVQELVNNTLKHAKATEIRIHVNQFEDEINIMYEDNGIGMVGSRFTGLGLHSIESRIRSLHGRMTWESNHKGTFYNFDVPLN